MTVLGVILARAGSKRVPGKNKRTLAGQSLTMWAVGCGMICPFIDELVVSSDDDDILEECRQFCKVVRRPKEMATDDASPYPAMLHALDEMGPHDHLCLLQPTSPFRSIEDVMNCIILCERNDLPAVASVEVGKKVPNGAVYVGRTDWLRDGGCFDGPAVGRYFMPPDRSLDIDTEDDFEQARQMVGGWMA